MADLVALKQLKGLGKGQEKKPDLIEVRLAWRPVFLRRRVLTAFFAVFAGVVIALEALLDYSGRHAGLGIVNQGLRYVLRFAPTALLTLIAVMWNRVEFQAKSAAPWLRMSRGPAEASKTLLLDYISMFQPKAVVRAIKGRDYAVAIATTISLLLRISVVVSAGLISVVFFTGMDENAGITMQSQFINNANGLAAKGPLALYTMLGLQQNNLQFPDGLSSQFAFQQFTSDLPGTTEFHATVDGFAGSLSCQPASLSLSSVENTPGGVQFTTAISAADCSATLPILSQSFLGSGAQNRSHFFARFGQVTCGSPNDKRILAVFGTGSIDSRVPPLNTTTTTTSINGTIPQSQQILCKPAYAINKVDVVKNSTGLQSIAVSSTPQTMGLDQVQPSDITQAFFTSFNNELGLKITDVASPAFSSQLVNTDGPMYLAFGMMASTQKSALTPTSFLDASTLQTLANSYFQQYTAILAQKALTQPSSALSSCVAFLSGDRLVVRRVAAQVLAALVSVMVLLDMILICLVPGKGFLPRDPGSIMDMATLAAHSKPLLQSLRGAGGADAATLRSRLDSSYFYTGVEAYDGGSSSSGQGYFKILGGETLETSPEFAEQTSRWPYMSGLHPAQRTLALLFVAGLIAGLEVTLRFSDRNNGLSAVGDDTFLHYLWTALPALVFAFIALFWASTDFSTRALAPYAELIRGGSFRSVSMNFLDKSAPTTLWAALRTRNTAVFGSTAAICFSALLPIFATSLFSTMTTPAATSTVLQSQDFFSNTIAAPNRQFCTTCSNGTLISSLILDGNVTYPAFTFEDLAFPTVQLSPTPASAASGDDISVTATLPAARPFMTCLFFRQSDLGLNLTNNYRTSGIVNPLRIDVPGEIRRGASELLASTFILGTSSGSSDITSQSIDANAFFGKADFRPIRLNDGSTVSHWVYAWGQLSNANTNQATVKFASALACNESMQQVNVSTTFSGLSLQIDPFNRPQPIESTAAPSNIGLSDTLRYTDLVNISTPHLLDGFFSSLVTSRFAIPASDLGSSDPSTAQNTVTQAIIFQHRIIRTQVVNTFNRRSTTTSTTRSQQFPTDINGVVMGDAQTLAFPATAFSITNGSRRVVQDAISTRIVQSLLGASVVFSILSWLAFRSPNILPRSPTSIASVVALLADGNIFGFFGRGAEWQPMTELRSLFRDGLYITAGFTLGWDRVRRRRREENLASLGMNGSVQKDEVFGISALRTGGWGGGENVGLGLQARVGYTQREFVKDLGWRT